MKTPLLIVLTAVVLVTGSTLAIMKEQPSLLVRSRFWFSAPREERAQLNSLVGGPSDPL